MQFPPRLMLSAVDAVKPRRRKSAQRNRWQAFAALAIFVSLHLLLPDSALACGSHGTNAGSDLESWISSGTNREGNAEAFIAIEDDFIVPSSTTICVCGIGLGSTAGPLPPSVQIEGAHVSVLNVVTRVRTHLAAFNFASNPITQAGLALGDSGDPATTPIFAGATWFGFSASVDPFTLPTLGPDEILVLGFDVALPPEVLPLLTLTQFAAGEGDASGSPLFSGSHRVEYFAAIDPLLELTAFWAVPSMGPLGGAAVGMLLALLGLRRLRA